MRMNKVLTIVVPTYNMQDYLHRCLDSLIVSDEQMAELEVLVINDGSKDNSSLIAHEYETKYPATFRVIDKENGNYGSCVNRGLKEAKGKYIKVLDADDWFDTDEFARFLDKLATLDVDMVLTKYRIVDGEGHTTQELSYDIEPNKVFDFMAYKDTETYLAMHAITYRTEMLRKMNYHQTEGISYTDTEWVYYPQHAVKTCVYLPLDVYRYLMGREGQTMAPEVRIRSASNHSKLIRSMVAFANNLSELDKQLYAYKRMENEIAGLCLGIYIGCLVKQDSDSFDEDFMREMDEFVRKERPQVYKQAGRLTLKYVPIHYVRFWRITGKRFPVDWIRETYRKMRYGNEG